eukprot:IDg15638t1
MSQRKRGTCGNDEGDGKYVELFLFLEGIRAEQFGILNRQGIPHLRQGNRKSRNYDQRSSRANLEAVAKSQYVRAESAGIPQHNVNACHLMQRTRYCQLASQGKGSQVSACCVSAGAQDEHRTSVTEYDMCKVAAVHEPRRRPHSDHHTRLVAVVHPERGAQKQCNFIGDAAIFPE